MKILLLFFLNLGIYFTLYSQQNIKMNDMDAQRSGYQGFMNWREAKENVIAFE